jgi:hypothetical protein
MGKTKRGEKPPGWETWSKRPYSCAPPGKKTKQITNRKERAAKKRLVKKEQEDAD